MKFNTQGLALVIVFQLIIAGATLYFTETNAGAVPCAIPKSDSEIITIGKHSGSSLMSWNPSPDENYLTHGEMSELVFPNECKNYTRIQKVFRHEIKTTHKKCEEIGDVCWFKGSAGCSIEDQTVVAMNQLHVCNCEIEFNYCTQTTPGIESEGKVERSLEKYK